VRGFSLPAWGFTAKTDWLLEEGGFEPLVPLTLNATNAGARDEKIAMTPLRRIGKPIANARFWRHCL
jgi:hypothetical protein